MRVALFTHCFLEPTHYAIGQMLDAVPSCSFRVFSRRFADMAGGEGSRHVVARELVTLARYRSNALARCDLVHAIYDGDIAFDAVEMAEHAGLPVVMSFHGGFDTNAKILDERYRARTLAACRSAAAITVVCETDRLRLSRLGITSGVVIIPVPIDLAILPPRSEPPKGSLLMIARLVPKKGVDTALECLSRLPPSFRLTVVGDGELRAALERQAVALGLADRVTWAGFLPLESTLSILAESDLLVHPARVSQDGNADGTPQAILWAQAAGIPVIATSAGSVPDVVRHRHTGLLVEPDSAEALSGAVLEVMSDAGLRRHLVATGRDAVQQGHELGMAAARLRAVYQNVRRAGPRPSRSSRRRDEGTVAALREAGNWLGVAQDSLQYEASGGHGHIYVLPRTVAPLAIKIPAYDRHDPDRWPVLEQKLAREWLILRGAAGHGLPEPIASDGHGRFMIRQFVLGEPLSRAVRYVLPRYRVALFLEVLALGRALFERFHRHQLGSFVLRDLKPQNIVVSTDGRLRLTLVDLGGVSSIGDLKTRDWDQARLGTGQWLHWAPEELLGLAEEMDERVDYFALGVTAYFSLTGRWPYSNTVAGAEGEVRCRYAAEYAVALENLAAAAHAEAMAPGPSQFVAECLDPRIASRRQTFDSKAPLWRGMEELSAAGAFGL